MPINVKYLNDAIDTNSEYGKKYIRLVSHADTNTCVEGHHIVPVAYYKHVLHISNCRTKGSIDTETSNMVNLSKGHHLLAHYYLMKCAKQCISYYMECAFKQSYKTTDVSDITERDVIRRIPDIDAAYNNLFRRVKQYTVNGEFVAEFANVADAARSIGLSRTAISRVINKKARTAKNYVYAYADTPISDIDFPGANYTPSNNAIPIKQYTISGRHVATYESKKVLCKILNISERCLTANLNGEIYATHNYVFALATTKYEDIKFPGNDYKPKDKEKPVAQYTVNGELVKTYNSLADAARAVNLGSADNITRVIRKERKVSKGYVWAYADTPVSEIFFPGENYKPKDAEKPVSQYTVAGEFVKTYNSLADAARAVNLGSADNITRVIRKERKVSKGYVWAYADTPVSEIFFPGENYTPNPFKQPMNQYNTDGKYIRSFETKIAAINELGGSKEGFRRACKNKTPYKKFLWRFSKDVEGTKDINPELE